MFALRRVIGCVSLVETGVIALFSADFMSASFAFTIMSLGRVVFLGVAAVGGAIAALKPEQRRKLKAATAKQLHKLANKLVEEANPPMWSESESDNTDQIDPREEELTAQEVASILSEDEVRTINGFKVKK
jgi:hypothetical protein